MSIASLIRRMADAGATSEAIALAVEAIEAVHGKLDEVRQASRERKRRQRERDRDVTVTGQDVTARDTLSLSPSPPDPPNPTPIPGDIYTPPAKVGPSNAEIARGFLAFWAAYPRRKSKDAAAKAFTKAMQRIEGADPLAVILAGIERALPGWDDPNFIPYPASWLNAGGWEDDPPQPRTGPTRNDRPSPDRKYDAKQANYAAALAGSEWADQVLAARREF